MGKLCSISVIPQSPDGRAFAGLSLGQEIPKRASSFTSAPAQNGRTVAAAKEAGQ
jgi:hypothetical protein